MVNQPTDDTVGEVGLGSLVRCDAGEATLKFTSLDITNDLV